MFRRVLCTAAVMAGNAGVVIGTRLGSKALAKKIIKKGKHKKRNRDLLSIVATTTVGVATSAVSSEIISNIWDDRTAADAMESDTSSEEDTDTSDVEPTVDPVEQREGLRYLEMANRPTLRDMINSFQIEKKR